MRRGDRGERALIGELPFAPPQSVFDEGGRRQVGVYANGKEAVLDEGQALTRNWGRLGCHTLPVRLDARQKGFDRRPGGRGKAGKIGTSAPWCNRVWPPPEPPKMGLQKGISAERLPG